MSRFLKWSDEHPPRPRASASRKRTGSKAGYEVFLSFKSEDAILARMVYDMLTRERLSVFFSQEELPRQGSSSFSREIDRALDEADCLIAIASAPGHLTARWVEYEYRSFHNRMLTGANSAGRIFSFIEGFSPMMLPLPLRTYEAITCDQRAPEGALNKLRSFVLAGRTARRSVKVSHRR